MTRRRARGQATIEFALVAPLFLACTLALVGTAVTCLRLVSLHDTARRAARAASVADDPCAAARVTVPERTRLTCTLDDSLGTVTVSVSATIGIALLDSVVVRVLPAMTATVMREPPVSLG